MHVRSRRARTPALCQPFSHCRPERLFFGPPMSEVSNEVSIALLAAAHKTMTEQFAEYKIHAEADLRRVKEDAEADIKGVREKADADNQSALRQIAALEDERTKALKWGVMTLGTAVMGMCYWIFDKLIKGEIR